MRAVNTSQEILGLLLVGNEMLHLRNSLDLKLPNYSEIDMWCWWWFSCKVVSDSCDSVDRSLSGSSVHGILQAGTLEWVAIAFSRDRMYTLLYLKWVTKEDLLNSTGNSAQYDVTV